MGKSTKRQYTSEFKKQAVDLAEEIGIKKAAERLGIPGGNMQRWKAEVGNSEKKVKRPKALLEEENRRLQAENLELKKVNHILKAAAAFFSRDHLK